MLTRFWAACIVCAGRCVAMLPDRCVYILGGLLGYVVYLCSRRYRYYSRQNLRAAYALWSPENLSSAARQSLNLAHFSPLYRAAIAESGRQMLEICQTWFGRHQDAMRRIVAVSGEHHLQQALAQGSVLVIGSHLGNFELNGRYLATKTPTTFLYRTPKHPVAQLIVAQGRQGPGMISAAADKKGIKILIKALRENALIAILPDQVPHMGEGVWCTFLGRPAWTMTLAARLSQNADTTLITWMERLPKGAGYQLHIEPMTPALTGDTEARAQIINDNIQRQILSCPSQYLWSYNRYKTPAGVAPYRQTDGTIE